MVFSKHSRVSTMVFSNHDIPEYHENFLGLQQVERYIASTTAEGYFLDTTVGVRPLQGIQNNKISIPKYSNSANGVESGDKSQLKQTPTPTPKQLVTRYLSNQAMEWRLVELKGCRDSANCHQEDFQTISAASK
ncbi:hypothetical protein CHS0354_005159 [Potamilus streckersoni]|uniref:Uncharacterized protein n=1 Tax=Potamilus streckersoni TaxID=2493646 RepID=A0AAE0RUV8_9BIVA|nr:hypothetical protein CHS0354_005159 [Potamilus streckersoni]